MTYNWTVALFISAAFALSSVASAADKTANPAPKPIKR
jgi:hypothetical protein